LLDDVVANYLDGLTEREFDAPLLSLLRSQGFDDVHLLHGAYEFGKDAIGKSDEPRTQYAFQSKAGNLGLPEWSSIRGQIDMLRLNDLAHPGFDRSLPRVGVLVLTGRLTGAAPLDVQEYQKRAAERDEPPLEVWDRDKLVRLIAASPSGALAGAIEAPFLELIGRIESGRTTESDVELFSRRWISEGAAEWRSFLEASIVANRLRHADRLDLSCFAALALLRGVWAAAHGTEPLTKIVDEQAAIARDIFIEYARELWEGCSDELLEPRALIGGDPDGIFVTYPVRCARLIELLGLLGLALDDGEERKEIATWLERFLANQPGSVHPISDRWAVSLIPALLLITSSAARGSALRELLRWFGDRYENDGLGLASSDAPPDVEVEFLLGNSLEHLNQHRRGTSYVAAVILDLAALLELPDVYDLAFNEVAAVDASPEVPIPNDDVAQYLVGAIPLDTSPRYAEHWSDRAGWEMAPHHDDDVQQYYLGRLGRYWDQLTLSVVTRDRHWVAGLRALRSTTEHLDLN
jgi:hypothetical protein